MPRHSSARNRVPEKPLIFISHNAEDGVLAAALAEAIHALSSKMLSVFYSSDNEGTNGIKYGENWFATIHEQLEKSACIICLLTKRSIHRPWILEEARGNRVVLASGNRIEGQRGWTTGDGNDFLMSPASRSSCKSSLLDPRSRGPSTIRGL